MMVIPMLQTRAKQHQSHWSLGYECRGRLRTAAAVVAMRVGTNTSELVAFGV